MEYRGYHFTKHALERLDLRRITKDDVITVLQKPTRTYPTGKDQTMKFLKNLDGRNVQVVATHLPVQKTWLVISVWVRGENDPQSLGWLFITAPFRFAWWLVKRLFASRQR